MSNLYHAGVSMQKPMNWVLDQFAPNNKVKEKELSLELDSSTTQSKTNDVGLTTIKRFAAIFVVFIGAPLYVIGAIFKVLGTPVTQSNSQEQTTLVEPGPSSDKKTAETTSSKTDRFATTTPLERTTSSSNLQSQKTSELPRTASFGATPKDISPFIQTNSGSTEQTKKVDTESSRSSDEDKNEPTSSKTHTFVTKTPLERTTSSSNLQSQKTSELPRTASFGATPKDTSSLFHTKSGSTEQTKKVDTESSRSIIEPYANTVLYYATLSQTCLRKGATNSEENANKAPKITCRKKRINPRTLLNLKMKRNTDTSKQTTKVLNQTEKANQATKPSIQLGGDLAAQVAAIAKNKQNNQK